MILVIDNYDSFTYNVAQILGEMGGDILVLRNDAATVADLAARQPDALVVSSGSGRPEDAGVSMDAVRAFAGRIPILGIGFGHHVVGACYGAAIVRAKRLMHGKTSEITCDGEGVFKGLGALPFKAMQYHSLVIDETTLPDALAVSARSPDGDIMAIRHRELPVEGLQFHPESIMTPVGKRILRNFHRSTASRTPTLMSR
jgi:anthranilate synthase/aminodeoxychorismate synthase-like glutamine amidotransferase